MTGSFVRAPLRGFIGNPAEESDPRWRAAVAVVVVYAFALRLAYAAQVELLPEETYYWNYARHLDIGYLDHPPLVAWLIRMGTFVIGDTELGVRIGAIGCGAATSLFLYRLTRNLFGDACALWALALAQVLPFFFLSGLLMTPDAPLTAAWAASLYYLERALIGGQARAWVWAGVSMGVGLISKYTIGLLGISAFLFMLSDPPSRRWFGRLPPYASVLVAAAIFAPVIVWNAEHEWASFAFQTARRLAEPARFSLHRLIASALVLLTPTGFAAALSVLRGCWSRGGAWRWLRFALLLPMAVFAVFSLRHDVKLDWTGAAWIAALPMMAFGLQEAIAGRAGGRRWLRIAWPATSILLLLLYGAGLLYLTRGIPGVGYSEHTEWAPVGWRSFARQIDGVSDALRNETGDDVLVVGLDRYAIASELAFYSRDQARAVAHTAGGHLFGGMGLMYERWFPPSAEAGRTLLLVSFDPADLAEDRLGGRVGRLEPVQQGLVMHDGVVVRRYAYRVAHDYRYP